MINNRKFFFTLPLFCIGFMMVIMGLRWMFSDEPWMLDKIANTERLGISFKELFKPHINSTLPDYLKQIYRFFGLWVLTIGLFVISFSKVALEKNLKFGCIY